jgi:hypothetical protein
MTNCISLFAGLTLGVSLLAGCAASSQQASQSGSAIVPFTHQVSLSSIAPDKLFCGGTNGVSVTPCPVKLTRKTRKTGVLVTVSGPGVTEAGIYYDACDEMCRYYTVGSNGIQWLIVSGSECGKARMGFNAVTTRGQPVGDGYLEVINKYCPT